MGLDNIPHRYACERLGSAIKVNINDKDGNPIMDDRVALPMKRIDCDATIAARLCPHSLALEKSMITNKAVHGLFGTPCWYRGKYGNYLLESMGIEGDETSFYGNNEDATYKSASDCHALATEMESHVKEFGYPALAPTDSDQDSLKDDIDYAIWWLRWVADECGGSDAWY